MEVWELKLYFYPSAGGLKQQNKKTNLLYSERDTKTIEALTYSYVCMNNTKTQKLLPVKILEAAYLLLLLVLVLLILLFRRRTIKMFKAFSWAKNTARGVRFLLRFNMYLFLAQCDRYTCFWHLPYRRASESLVRPTTERSSFERQNLPKERFFLCKHRRKRVPVSGTTYHKIACVCMHNSTRFDEREGIMAELSSHIEDKGTQRHVVGREEELRPCDPVSELF